MARKDCDQQPIRRNHLGSYPAILGRAVSTAKAADALSVANANILGSAEYQAGKMPAGKHLEALGKFLSAEEVQQELSQFVQKTEGLYGPDWASDMVGGQQMVRRYTELMQRYDVGKDSATHILAWRAVLADLGLQLQEAANVVGVRADLGQPSPVEELRFLKQMAAYESLTREAATQQRLSAQRVQSGNIDPTLRPLAASPVAASKPSDTGMVRVGSAVEKDPMNPLVPNPSIDTGQGSAFAEIAQMIGTPEGEQAITTLANAVRYAGLNNPRNSLKTAAALFKAVELAGDEGQRDNWIKSAMINGLMSAPPGWIATLTSGVIQQTLRPLAQLMGSATMLGTGTLTRNVELTQNAKQAMAHSMGEIIGGAIAIPQATRFALQAWANHAPQMIPGRTLEYAPMGSAHAEALATMASPTGQLWSDGMQFLHELLNMPSRINMTSSEFVRQLGAYQQIAGEVMVRSISSREGAAAEGLFNELPTRGEEAWHGFSKELETALRKAYLYDADGTNTGELNQKFAGMFGRIDEYNQSATLEKVGPLANYFLDASQQLESALSNVRLPGVKGTPIEALDLSVLYRSLMPFPKTSLAVIGEMLQWSPLAVISPTFIGKLKSSNPAEKALALGQVALGGLILTAVHGLWQAGMIQGGPPSTNKEDYAKFQDLNNVYRDSEYYTFKLGNKNVPYKRGNDIVGTLVGIATDLFNTMKYEQFSGQSSESFKVLGTLIGIVGAGLADVSFLEGLGTFAGLFTGETDWTGKPSAKLAGQVTSSFVPFSSLIAYTQRLGSENAVDLSAAATWAEGAQAYIRNRFSKAELPIKRDFIYGEPIPQNNQIGGNNDIGHFLANTVPMFPRDAIQAERPDLKRRGDTLHRIQNLFGGWSVPPKAIYYNGDTKLGRMSAEDAETVKFKATHDEGQTDLFLPGARISLDLRGKTLPEALESYMGTGYFRKMEESTGLQKRFVSTDEASASARGDVKLIFDHYYSQAWDVMKFLDPSIAGASEVGRKQFSSGVDQLKKLIQQDNRLGAAELGRQQLEQLKINRGIE